MLGREIRTARAAADISGTVLCLKAGISRSRLSEIEREYRNPSAAEVEQIKAAIEELRAAKQQIRNYASSLGWSVAAGGQ
jgi:transcriptional regulator with XRE-family HTH domain